MSSISIDKLDNLFKSYNYEVSTESNEKVRIYTLRYGMYHAAEIILLDEKFDVSEVKNDFSSLGYATEVKKFNNGLDIEEYLFEGFFIKTPLGNELKSRYSQFVKRQLQNLPDNSHYSYIQSAYDLLYIDETGSVIEKNSYNGVTEEPLVEKIYSILTRSRGAVFIIIEAPAGFGKTCTANELLQAFSKKDSKKLPFFTELSRNREARIFKHILLNEIDAQFPSGIKQNIVIEQISKGRIPLIIDGFDELITKESNKEEVESMLTTIVDLLKDDAKVIITSRKTAIFDGDEFITTINESVQRFSLARFEIKEPTIENWFDEDRLDLIKASDFPLEQISNPVLLAYLRNIPFEKLESYINNYQDGSLAEKYIDYLLDREQTRQNLKLNSETQLRVFRKLMRFLTEFNVTAESKNTIKDLIKEYNKDILQNSLKDYVPEERPSIDDLVETLSNHVFLDRKPNGNLGIVNDFIFGWLVGENLVKNKYQDYYSKFYEIIPQSFARKSVQTFRVQSRDNQQRLWQIYNENQFPYSAEFYFEIDRLFLGKFIRGYKNLCLDDIQIKNTEFDGNAEFNGCSFSNISFLDCGFNLSIFENCTFHNCTFINCVVLQSSNEIEFKDFAILACESNNDFLNLIYEMVNYQQPENDENLNLTEMMILRCFFAINGLKPKAKKLSYIKQNFSDFSTKEISRIVSSLKNKEFICFKDDVAFITKKGINFYNLNRSGL